MKHHRFLKLALPALAACGSLALVAMIAPQTDLGESDLNGCDPEINPYKVNRLDGVEIFYRRSTSTNGLIELVIDVGADAEANMTDRDGKFEGVSMGDIDLPKGTTVTIDYVYDSTADAIDATVSWAVPDPPSSPTDCSDCRNTRTESRTWDDLPIYGKTYDPYVGLSNVTSTSVDHPTDSDKKAMRFSMDIKGLTMGIVLKDQ